MTLKPDEPNPITGKSIWDLQEDMGFSSKEAYERFLNGEDEISEASARISRAEEKEALPEDHLAYVLLLMLASKDVRIVGVFKTRKSAEKVMDEFLAENPSKANSLVLREGVVR